MPKSRNKRKKLKQGAKQKRSTAFAAAPPPPKVPTESLFHLMGLGSTGQTDEEREAQELIYGAWELADPQARIRSAQHALGLWPDCADAWVILAEDKAATLDKVREFYAAGMAAGERSLGQDAFTDDVGHFWGILETRPYMRARQGLARALIDMGQIDEAAEHLNDMLRLNPGDNQGIRYVLLHLLLDQSRHDDAAHLINEYADDVMAEWVYSRALLTFRQEGPSGMAAGQLAAARSRNEFVPAYLLGRRRLPKQLPPTISLGGKDEAIAYAADYKTLWQQTPGALDWLKSNKAKNQ